MENEKTDIEHMPIVAAEEKKEMSPEKPRGGVWSFVWEVIRFAFLAIIIVVPIRVYVAQPYLVSGSSMDPTFQNGNYLIVDQISYRFEDPERGDVIIFRFPQNPSKFFIKRIIGLPNETLRIQNGVITAMHEENGATVQTPLKEEYITQLWNDSLEVTLKDDEYFVMGDNRGASLDSRIWGPLQEDFIMGRALVRLLPVTGISLFPGKAEYEDAEQNKNLPGFAPISL